LDIDCTIVPRLVEKALEALDAGHLDEVRDVLLAMKDTASKGPD
jgi:hypothetical protein